MEFQYLVDLWMCRMMQFVNLEMYYIRVRLDFVVRPSNKYVEASTQPCAHMTLIRDVVRALVHDKSYNDCLLT